MQNKNNFFKFQQNFSLKTKIQLYCVIEKLQLQEYYSSRILKRNRKSRKNQGGREKQIKEGKRKEIKNFFEKKNLCVKLIFICE